MIHFDFILYGEMFRETEKNTPIYKYNYTNTQVNFFQ